MKKVLLVAFLSLSFLFGFGQNVPNPGFEAWIDYGDYEDPKNWNSPNEVTSGLGVFTVSKSTDVFAGNFAVKLESASLMGGLFKVPGTITLGEFEIDFINQTAIIVGGIPFSNRPDKLSGNFKYFPMQEDYMQAFVFLYKRNPDTGLRDTIGTGYYSMADTVDTWSPFDMDIMYSSNEEPDSLNIIIMASDIVNVVEGSTLLVDSLMFEYATGMEEVVQDNQIKAFPNPCNQQIAFEVPEGWENSIVSIFNSSGQLMCHEAVRTRQFALTTDSYPDGVYFYRVRSGQEMKSGTFIVSH